MIGFIMWGDDLQKDRLACFKALIIIGDSYYEQALRDSKSIRLNLNKMQFYEDFILHMLTVNF